MLKDASYHKAAVQYNEELADFARDLADRIEHEEVARWSRSVANQHRFHAIRHKKALAKITGEQRTVDTEDGGEDRVIDDDRVVHRSAESGEFVTAKEAAEHPKTTTEEHVSAPRAGGDVRQPFKVAEAESPQAADPAES